MICVCVSSVVLCVVCNNVILILLEREEREKHLTPPITPTLGNDTQNLDESFKNI